MPVWNQKTKQWIEQGKLVVIAIAQEHHADRSRLFAQWHDIDWPILHDPINVMQVTGVPIEIAIDEYGIVRSTRPSLKTFEKDFLNYTFTPDSPQAVPEPAKAARPDLAAMRRRAENSQSSLDWRKLGDALVFWAEPDQIEKAMEAYKKAVEIDPTDSDAHFRLGVCYRMRSESPKPMPNDFKTAVDYWTKARRSKPNQYIWRRRLEQYGPRLEKPYPFYNWVETAAKEIESRGQKPVKLQILPTGSEIATPARSFDADRSDIKEPDPQGRIFRDEESLVQAEITIVPQNIKPAQTARVHITFRPNQKLHAHWNNEAQPLKLWIDPPQGWKTNSRLLTAPQGKKPETSEPRTLEFELLAPADAKGKTTLNAYALYYVCEGLDGVCFFLRQDIPINLTVDP